MWDQQEKRIFQRGLLSEYQQLGRCREPVRTLVKLLLILLVIPLLIVMATRDPQGIVHLVEVIFTVGCQTAQRDSGLPGQHARRPLALSTGSPGS
jgi:hypothetical protein